MNSAPVLYQDDEYSLSSKIQKFLYEKFDACFIGGEFMEDIYSLFTQEHGDIPYHVFAREFTRLAGQMYKARDSRKRRNGVGNPISFMEGIKIQ